ncbi:MAG: hypothetical protein ACSHW1_19105 [Yoonia sp.]|uniref:hypothetical protein n=1 Tax=Yoonia sp. TaxID=2212373 RepID=UPI003EF770FE
MHGDDATLSDLPSDRVFFFKGVSYDAFLQFSWVAPMLDSRDMGDDDCEIWTSWDNVVWDGIPLAQHGGNARPVDRLKDIPTGYNITHADARLMAQAAYFLVKYMLP